MRTKEEIITIMEKNGWIYEKSCDMFYHQKDKNNIWWTSFKEAEVMLEAEKELYDIHLNVMYNYLKRDLN